jgi:hypothetical protein
MLPALGEESCAPKTFPTEFSMRSHVKAIFAVLGIVLVAACNDSTAVNGDASGTYTLSAINGSPLPFILSATTTDTLVIKSGNIVINADGTFVETLSADKTISGVTTTQTNICPGNYAQRGDAFTFNETLTGDASCGGSYGARWNGSDTMSLLFTGYTLDYIKTTVSL